MDFELSVTAPFGDYQRGDRITDHEDIQKIMASENAIHVVRAAASQNHSDEQN